MISLDVSYGFSYVLSSTMLPVSLAIRPITVLSPVFTTIPVQVPVYGDDLVTVGTMQNIARTTTSRICTT